MRAHVYLSAVAVINYDYLRGFVPPKLPMSSRSKHPAKNEEGDFDRFKTFMTGLMAVPHSKIKAALDAEKRAKMRKSNSKKASARHASGVKGADNS